MSDHADNLIGRGSLSHDAFDDTFTARIEQSRETHLTLPGSLLPAAKIAAMGGPASWASWLATAPLPPEVRAWQSLPAQDKIREIYAGWTPPPTPPPMP